MAKRVRFGTGIGRHESMHEVAEHAVAAEQYGMEHLTILDDIQLTRDVYAMLAVAAVSTSKVLLETGVTHTKTRHPVQTAVAIASIRELSGGRAFLGLGAGHLNSLLGLRPGTIDELRELITITRGLSRGRQVQPANDVKVWSPWMHQPYPIYLGADGVASMRLGGELADAIWVHGFHSTLVKWRFENIARGAEATGRSREDIDVWLRTMVVIADSKEEARDIARPYSATIGHQFCMANLRRNNDEVIRLK